MTLLAVAGAALAITLAAWCLLQAMARVYAGYQRNFQSRAEAGLGEFFLFLDPRRLWALNVLACAGFTLAVCVVSGSPVTGLLAGALALATPWYVLRRLRRRRLRRLDDQLPDFLLALAGALRAGQGMQMALKQIVPQAPEPLSQEFSLMLREQRMGVAFDDALAGLYRRVPSEGAGLVVSSLRIAAHSGGNLAETLERIAATVRARSHLLGRIRALTAQGRLQAGIMALLPPAMALVLGALDADAASALWHTSAGWMVLGAVAVLEAAGVLLIRRIVDIDV
jgi:tight adherence protein B